MERTERPQQHLWLVLHFQDLFIPFRNVKVILQAAAHSRARAQQALPGLQVRTLMQEEEEEEEEEEDQPLLKKQKQK